MSKAPNAGNIVRRFPVASGCLAGCLVLGGLFFLRQSTLSDELARLEVLESEGKKLALGVRNATGIEEHLAALKTAIGALEGKLTRVDDVSGNQEYFYSLESGTGVRVSILRPLGPPKTTTAGQAYQPTGFNVVVEGEYVQLIRFLRTLEQGPRLYRLSDFAVQRASAEANAAQKEVLTINLQLLAAK